jgi:hypothetical protein
MTNRIFLDMDGVLADFNGYAQEKLNLSNQARSQAHKDGRWNHDVWLQLKTIPNLYYQLPKTSIADQLVATARLFRDHFGWSLGILTAVPRANDCPDAFHDKILWIQQYYPDLRVYFGPYSRDKAGHCRSGDLLIDDREENCRDWSQQGGQVIAVNWPDEYNAVLELNSLYQQLKG